MFRLLFLLLPALFLSCGQPDGHNHDHGHDHDHAHGHEHEEIHEMKFTAYSDSAHIELFAKYHPLVKNRPSDFEVFVSDTRGRFRPVKNGSLTLSLIVGDEGIRASCNLTDSSGIFPVQIRPVASGKGYLIFDLRLDGRKLQFQTDEVEVFEKESDAFAAADQLRSDQILYKKEQAWNSVFSSEPVKKQHLYEVLRASGQIENAPGEETTISATIPGIVKFHNGPLLPGVTVKAGQRIFSISGGDLAGEENIDIQIREARAEEDAARREFERMNELMEDQLVTREEFQRAKLRFEHSQIRLSALLKNYSSGGKSINTPVSGFIKQTLVTDGQFVTSGQPLAVISKSRKVLLRADVPVSESSRLAQIGTADFRFRNGEVLYNTGNLNGRKIAIPKATNANSPFLPFYFEIDFRPEFISGSVVEIFLNTGKSENNIAIPVNALMEEQGIYFVYVQTGGESFEKREVQPGANDGTFVKINRGLNEGERVVTKGAYQVRLASMSSAMPIHDHAH
ncbi:MAG TPA: efflux RND transporter periplasmic adaptor subunit [Parasegetibacter sp.]